MEEKKPFQWDFDGACMPTKGDKPVMAGQKTFSLGIFQWIPTANGKGLKRSRVVKRIKGDFHSPEQAFSQAKSICEKWNQDLQDLREKQSGK